MNKIKIDVLKILDQTYLKNWILELDTFIVKIYASTKRLDKLKDKDKDDNDSHFRWSSQSTEDTYFFVYDEGITRQTYKSYFLESIQDILFMHYGVKEGGGLTIAKLFVNEVKNGVVFYMSEKDIKNTFKNKVVSIDAKVKNSESLE